MPKTCTQARSPAPAGDAELDSSNAASASGLCRELTNAGARPMLVTPVCGILTAGMAMSIDADLVLGSELSAGRFREQASNMLASGLPLTVSIGGLWPGPDAGSKFGLVCELLGNSLDAAGVGPQKLEIAVPADTLLPRAISDQRRRTIGSGPVHLLAGRALMRPHSGAGVSRFYRRFWSELWRERDRNCSRPAYAALVTSHCSLLEAEFADTLLPWVGLQVPLQTAWLPMQVDLARFADSRGTLDEHALECALCNGVILGDALHDHINWPSAHMRQDAWLNRRLAVLITGIGDLVARRKQDPREFSCLRDFDDLLAWVSTILRSASRRVAQQHGHLPALDLCDPTRDLLPGLARDAWRARWQHALAACTTRNRNLLALSPWSLFPVNSPIDSRYLDLLPLLDYADTCTFAEPPRMRGWNLNKFKLLHQRAWAVLERKIARQRIAKQV